MADHATRQVPLEPDDHDSAESPKLTGEQSLAELRRLILAPEQEQIACLQERIGNTGPRTRDVSEVLPEAMRLRRQQGGEAALGEALAPSVEAALRESVRKDPGTLADALFPVMGPAIRRSIQQTLRSLFESFNETMEQSLSVRGLRWRFEALRTGRPFSEVVLMHSLLYRVEQVFLIHKKTGLPLAHAVAPAVAMQDASLVSGMLTAIQDFVRDSFDSPAGEGVEKLNVGGLEVWLEAGPYAGVAAVIRGMAPPDLRTRLTEAVELIHRKYSAELERFDGDSGPFAAAGDILSPLLDSQYKEKQSAIGRPKPYILVFAGVVLLALAGWLSVRWWQDREWGKFADTLRRQPGIVVTSFGRGNGHFVVRGLRDPLSADPKELLRGTGLDAGKAEFHWGGYYALDDAIIEKRAGALLRPPVNARLLVQDGVLHVEGEARGRWIENLRAQAPLIAGIRGVDVSQLIDADQAELDRWKAAIEAAVVKFPVGSAEISIAEQSMLKELTLKMTALVERSHKDGREMVIEVVGHSDSTGAEATNRPLSQNRAERVQGELARQGLNRTLTAVRGVAATEPLRSEDNEEARQYNRSVTFRILLRGNARP